MTTRHTPSTGTRLAACAALVAFAAAGLSVAQTTPAPAASPPPGAAQAQPGAKSFSQEQLDQLLAPIALYPDGLLAQVMMAATYPIEIVTAERWVKANPGLKDKALEDALQKQPWDASVKSLAAFPQVLTMMSEKLDWTQQVGDAFLAQQQDVASTIQNLRAKASKEGNLQDTKEQKIVTEQVESKTIIKIEPANPQVVYVPTYNPTVVYGSWWYPSYPPYYYYPPGYVAAGAAWGFVAGAAAGAIWGNWNWGGGNVDIDVNRYNNFNRTNISNKSWNHDASHRGAVPYKDQRVAQQYNKGASPGSANRDAYRGRDGGGDMGRGPSAGTMDRGAQGGRGDQGRGPSAGTMDRGGAGGVSASPRDSFGGASASTRDMSGTRNASALNTGSASQTRAASSRGNTSMNSSRASAGASRPSGGASRGGGGGGRGGGGRR